MHEGAQRRGKFSAELVVVSDFVSEMLKMMMMYCIYNTFDLELMMLKIKDDNAMNTVVVLMTYEPSISGIIQIHFK